jgi:hypothetical protein
MLIGMAWDKIADRIPRHFDQQVYHSEESFRRCYIYVDSIDFVEMFFVAGSIS